LVGAFEFETDFTTYIAISDLHIANRNTDEKAIERVLSEAKKKDYGIFVLGDLAEAIRASDKRFDMGTVNKNYLGDNMIGKQYRTVERLFKPVADQLFIVHSGNHDDAISKYCHVNKTRELCENLGVIYSKYTAMSRIYYEASGKKFSYVIYTTHGHGAGTTTGGRINTLEKLPNSRDGDIFLMGHSHGLSISPKPKQFMKYGDKSKRIKILKKMSEYELSAKYTDIELLNSELDEDKAEDSKLIGTRQQWFGNTGSFLKSAVEGQDSYAERAGYPLLNIGYIKFTLDPKKHGVSMSTVIL
jgi:predicted phosphodiesterase